MPEQKCIIFTKAAVDIAHEIPAIAKTNPYVASQAYILETFPAEQMIQITAATPQGAFYAVQTLVSILFLPEAEDTSVTMLSSLAKFRIVDAPRYSYRGLHVGKNSLSYNEGIDLYYFFQLHLFENKSKKV